MTADRLINLLAVVALAELMLTLGVGTTVAELWAVARDLGAVARATLANYVVVPAAAVALALLVQPHPMVACGAMVVAVCPGAPYAPPFTALAKGRVEQAVGLMVILAGSSAILAPLLLQGLLPLVTAGGSVSVDGLKIVATLALTQFLPLCAGLCAAAYRPALASLLKKPLARLGTVLNVGLIGVILAVQFRMLAAIRVVGYAAMLTLLLASGLAGWLLARHNPADRRTLAVTSAVRNVGVGLVIAGGSFPGTPAVTFVTAYALIQTVVVALAVTAVGRRTAAPQAPAPEGL
jgi:BASS family bile acid:Na+ symporter